MTAATVNSLYDTAVRKSNSGDSYPWALWDGILISSLERQYILIFFLLIIHAGSWLRLNVFLGIIVSESNRCSFCNGFYEF